MAKMANPLAEVFGHITDDFSEKGKRFRKLKLCPFNNIVPNCTKDKAKKPLGVCSVFCGNSPVITCPIRFRENWIIADDAAEFFFDENAEWSSLTEVRLNDAEGNSAGNIDIVLVAYDEKGRIYDFGAVEIQAVYISGNVRNPFEYYMENPEKRAAMDWTGEPNYPRPDFLSSSRKRLIPQIVFKGGILNSWNKKSAIVIDRAFFETLPHMAEVPKSKAQIAWLIYDLVLTEENGNKSWTLKKTDVKYTEFETSLASITTPKPGKITDFMNILQGKLDDKLETPPDNNTIEKPF